ncbi:hypothetical protein ACFLTL_02055 [Chloroflexota bacterium]
MTDLKIGDRVKIVEHDNNEYVGKTGILLSARAIGIFKDGQKINQMVSKIKLDDTGEIVDCVLSQIK